MKFQKLFGSILPFRMNFVLLLRTLTNLQTLMGSLGVKKHVTLIRSLGVIRL